MKKLIMVLMGLALSACAQDVQLPNVPAERLSITNDNLACTGPEDVCDGALICVADNGLQGCVDAPRGACSGVATCECEGTWLCGDRACVDVEGGFQCEAGPRAPACAPDDCGPQVSLACATGSGPVIEPVCEPNQDGQCEWTAGSCGEALPVLLTTVGPRSPWPARPAPVQSSSLSVNQTRTVSVSGRQAAAAKLLPALLTTVRPQGVALDDARRATLAVERRWPGGASRRVLRQVGSRHSALNTHGRNACVVGLVALM